MSGNKLPISLSNGGGSWPDTLMSGFLAPGFKERGWGPNATDFPWQYIPNGIKCRGDASPLPMYWGAIMLSERKQGLSAEPVPVSAYGGSSKNLKDLKRRLGSGIKMLPVPEFTRSWRAPWFGGWFMVDDLCIWPAETMRLYQTLSSSSSSSASSGSDPQR